MVAFAKGVKILQSKFADRALLRANPFGKIVYLDSQNGVDGNPGDSALHPVKTLSVALGKMVAGDTLVLDPGGSETVTAAVAISLARVRIVCPVENPEQGFTIQGAGTLDLLTPSAADITLEGLIFKHTGATANQACINAAAGADRLHVKNCIFDDSAISATWSGNGIELTDACNGVKIEGCRFKDLLFGVKSVVANAIVQAGLEIRDNEFWIGQTAAFGIGTALAGSGALRGLVAMRNKFMELNGSGAAATAAWDGTDGTNATQGPIKLEAAADQYLIAENVAYTALSTSFDKINAINAGAAGSLVQNKTAVGGDVEDNVTTINTNVTTLVDQLAGGTGIASFPNAAVPANNVSIAEVLRDVWAGLMGTAAGENGVQTFPAAAAPGNNVSLAEVIRAIYDRQLGDGTNSNTNARLGKKVTRAAADVFDGTQKALFTVSGGRVLLTHLELEVSGAAIDAGASNTKIISNPTVGADLDLCANLDINADVLGSLYTITGVLSDALQGGVAGGSVGMQRPVVLPEGTIDLNTVADVGTGGALGAAELWYIPLDDGASVAAA